MRPFMQYLLAALATLTVAERQALPFDVLRAGEIPSAGESSANAEEGANAAEEVTEAPVGPPFDNPPYWPDHVGRCGSAKPACELKSSNAFQKHMCIWSTFHPLFDEWVACGLRTEELCEGRLPGSTTSCKWVTHQENSKVPFGRGRCAPPNYGVWENIYVCSTLYQEIKKYDGIYADLKDVPTVLEQSECLRHSRQSAAFCNAQVDSKGRACSYCQAGKKWMYNWDDVPTVGGATGRDAPVQLCLNTNYMPRQCDFLNESEEACPTEAPPPTEAPAPTEAPVPTDAPQPTVAPKPSTDSTKESLGEDKEGGNTKDPNNATAVAATLAAVVLTASLLMGSI